MTEILTATRGRTGYRYQIRWSDEFYDDVDIQLMKLIIAAHLLPTFRMNKFRYRWRSSCLFYPSSHLISKMIKSEVLFEQFCCGKKVLKSLVYSYPKLVLCRVSSPAMSSTANFKICNTAGSPSSRP